ncbi:MAG: efflux RND transporter periplasmic adaptor subunit [Alphaproteobacteria bacterium]|nr:efflux RND transporter periplasmic adaptor subunit [Alphaproteobacteria bacterium]
MLILSTAVGVWVSRDDIAKAFANFTGPGAGKAALDKRKTGRDRPVPVIVKRVERMRNDETIAAIGTARARRSIMLFAKSDGEIVSLPFKPGERVAQGQVLLELDSAKAKLAVGIAGKTVEEMEQKLGRSQYLKKRRVGSGASVEDARIILDRARLEVMQAQEQLRDMKLVAPFDGYVGIAKVDVGERVTRSTEIVSLDDRSELFVEFEMPEQFIGLVKVSDRVSAATPSYAKRKFIGRIGYIDSRVNPTSRTVMVRAVIPNGDDLLRPGMSFAIEVNIRGEEFGVVPELALQWRSGGSFVWIVENETVRQVPVRLVRRRNAIVFIEGEVSAGELVVIEGVQRLRPGKRVRFEAPRQDSLSGRPDTGRPEAVDAPKSSLRTKSEQKG